MTADTQQPPSASFESALARLETLVKEMEAGDLPLDQMMAHFEEGSKLVKHCNTTLDGLEKKIETLIQQEGTAKTVPFEAERLADD